MTPETIQRLEEELAIAYSGVSAATDGSRRLLRLPVQFPDGCRPATTEAIIALDPSATQPQLHLLEVPALPNGTRPNVGTTTVAGQSWQTFSFNVLWDEGRHTAVQFVEAKLARFRRAA
jgi:hypothetical protein